MTDPATPATDEEVDDLRNRSDIYPEEALRLIARIDAERAERRVMVTRPTDAEMAASEALVRVYDWLKRLAAVGGGLRGDAEANALRVAEAQEVIRKGLNDRGLIDAERAALTESEAVRDRMRALLDAIAVAVRGPPAPNALHDHARLPDEVAALVARAERAEAALRCVALRNGDDGPCFCSVVAGPHHLSCLNARAALSQEKEGGK